MILTTNYTDSLYTLLFVYFTFYSGFASIIFIVHVCAISGEARPTFGHVNANFSVFRDRIRNQFLKK